MMSEQIAKTGRNRRPPSSPIIGRDRELATLAELLAHPEVHLVTLTGPGGVGKTRLAVQAAVSYGDAQGLETVFVPLAPVSDPGLVLNAIGRELGVRKSGRRPLADHLLHFLRGRPLLLLLDNFEQVVEAAGELVPFIDECPDLLLLVTSRERLRLTREYEFAVPPLGGASRLRRREPTRALKKLPAVQLFIERVRSFRPGWEPVGADLQAVADICGYLDGLPLAIELAAARMRLFTPRELWDRLASPSEPTLALLADKARDRPPRQQTLRHAIRWSYELLGEGEQQLLRWLAVFAGGFTLEAVEAVVGSGWEALTSLVDKSLVSRSEKGGASRYVLLAAVREFALELLQNDPNREGLYREHSRYFVKLAERGAQHLNGPRQVEWANLLEEDHHNFQAALRHAQDQKDSETFLRLGTALWRYWILRGEFSDGRWWADGVNALAESQEKDLDLAAKYAVKALAVAGLYSYFPGNFDLAIKLLKLALRFSTAGADAETQAMILWGLGRTVLALGQLEKAEAYFKKSLAISQEEENTQGVANALYGLGRLAWARGLYDDSRMLHQNSLRLYQQERNDWDSALSSFVLAQVALFRGDYSQAENLIEEAVQMYERNGSQVGQEMAAVWQGWIGAAQGKREGIELLHSTARLSRSVDMPRNLSMALIGLGDAALEAGDTHLARSYFSESLAAARSTNELQYVAISLEGLAAAAGPGQEEEAVRRLGTASALRNHWRLPLPPFRQARYEALVRTLRHKMEPAVYQHQWEAGEENGADYRPAFDGGWDPPVDGTLEELTPRELQVLQLVAQGMTDSDIAARLVISPRTVHAHLRHIYEKLGVKSRTAAARKGLEAGLI